MKPETLSEVAARLAPNLDRHWVIPRAQQFAEPLALTADLGFDEFAGLVHDTHLTCRLVQIKPM